MTNEKRNAAIEWYAENPLLTIQDIVGRFKVCQNTAKKWLDLARLCFIIDRQEDKKMASKVQFSKKKLENFLARKGPFETIEVDLDLELGASLQKLTLSLQKDTGLVLTIEDVASYILTEAVKKLIAEEKKKAKG